MNPLLISNFIGSINNNNPNAFIKALTTYQANLENICEYIKYNQTYSANLQKALEGVWGNLEPATIFNAIYLNHNQAMPDFLIDSLIKSYITINKTQHSVTDIFFGTKGLLSDWKLSPSISMYYKDPNQLPQKNIEKLIVRLLCSEDLAKEFLENAQFSKTKLEKLFQFLAPIDTTSGDIEMEIKFDLKTLKIFFTKYIILNVHNIPTETLWNIAQIFKESFSADSNSPTNKNAYWENLSSLLFSCPEKLSSDDLTEVFQGTQVTDQCQVLTNLNNLRLESLLADLKAIYKTKNISTETIGKIEQSIRYLADLIETNKWWQNSNIGTLIDTFRFTNSSAAEKKAALDDFKEVLKNLSRVNIVIDLLKKLAIDPNNSSIKSQLQNNLRAWHVQSAKLSKFAKTVLVGGAIFVPILVGIIGLWIADLAGNQTTKDFLDKPLVGSTVREIIFSPLDAIVGLINGTAITNFVSWIRNKWREHKQENAVKTINNFTASSQLINQATTSNSITSYGTTGLNLGHSGSTAINTTTTHSSETIPLLTTTSTSSSAKIISVEVDGASAVPTAIN